MDKTIPTVVALLCAAALALWLGGTPADGLQPRLPQPTKSTEPPVEWKPITATGRLDVTGRVPAPLPGAWPGFRGPRADNVAADQPDLARSWGEQGPPVVWSVSMGRGHAGAAVLNGRVYVLDYDETGRRDALRCLSLADGAELWRFSYPIDVRRQYGMSRTVPAVTDQYVVALGPKCHVTCVDAATGELRWAYDLPHDFGAEVPQWYAGQCPLIDNGRAIVAVGGPDILMMAVDCETGDVIWTTPNPGGWKMTHSSVMLMTLAGRRMYVYCGSGGVVAVSADDGRVLWRDETWQVPFANVPSPVVLGDGRVLLTGGYGAGSLMLRITPAADAFRAERLYRLKQDVFGAEQHTPIFHRGYVYGVLVDGRLACLDPAGRQVWASGRAKTFRRGPYLIANDLIYVLSDDGVLTLAEATPAGYRPLAEAKVLPAPDASAWGPMAMADGLLIVRDETTMTCLDVRRK